MFQFFDSFQSGLITVLLFVLVIGILIFVHEFGHFLAAKLIKAKVLEFALGMGPKIFSRKYKGTEYKLNLLPIGGYVRIYGELGADDEKGRGSFQSKKPLQKIFVMIAGIVFNLITAIFLYYILFSFVGYEVYFSRQMKDFRPIAGEISYMKISDEVKYASLVKDGNAYKAGLPASGTISSINGKEIKYSYEVDEIVVGNIGEEVKLNICVQNECNDYTVQVSSEGKMGMYIEQNFFSSLSYEKNKWLSGLAHPFNVIKLSIYAIGDVFNNAKQTGDYTVAINTVSGPVGIYLAIDSLKVFGLIPMISLVADLSVALAFMNILPIPALDGGRILFVIPELITGKRINKKFEMAVVNITYILLLGLMVIIAIKDFVYIDVLRSFLK